MILPIYFVTTPLLEKDDLLESDPLALEISRRQRYDWRAQADPPTNDPIVRRAVKDLSERIGRALQRTHAVSPRDQSARRFQAQLEIETASEKLSDQAHSAQTKIVSRNILWVDDRPDNNIFERKAMEAYSIQFTLAKSTREALEKITDGRFDAIISDMGRPPDARAGYTLLETLRARGYKTPYFIYAGSRAPEHVAEAVRRGAQGSTNVPDELIALVLAALETGSSG